MSFIYDVTNSNTCDTILVVFKAQAFNSIDHLITKTGGRSYKLALKKEYFMTEGHIYIP